ncbi:MAG: HK97 gp10 family phage protein [Pseudomonas sp.]
MEELIKKSRGLSNAVRIRLARNAVMAGARVIRDKARDNARRLDDPETGRQIADNVAVRFRRKITERTGDPTASVGVLMTRGKIPEGNPDRPENTNHWIFFELGNEHQAAQPFLVPAAHSTAGWIPQQIADNLSKGIDRELAKL